jgi:hypothetical protein
LRGETVDVDHRARDHRTARQPERDAHGLLLGHLNAASLTTGAPCVVIERHVAFLRSAYGEASRRNAIERERSVVRRDDGSADLQGRPVEDDAGAPEGAGLAVVGDDHPNDRAGRSGRGRTRVAGGRLRLREEGAQ